MNNEFSIEDEIEMFKANVDISDLGDKYDESMFIVTVINDDGSKFNPPPNPLEEKWKRLYHPMKYGQPCSPVCGYFEDGRPIMNYTCVVCHEQKCPYSNSWIIPEEDREVYDAWKKERDTYFKEHNPIFIKKIEEGLKVLIES